MPEPVKQHESRFDDLLIRYYDHALNESEMKELNQRLREHPEAREAFAAMGLRQTMVRESMRLETERAERIVKESHPTSPTKSPIPLSPHAAFALAACLVMVASVAWVVWMPTRAPLAHVIASGPGVWVERDGEKFEIREPTRLSGGETLMTVNASATVHYEDGTEIELRTGSAAHWANATDANQVTVKYGTLIADVKPQHEDRPLKIITPHATATILGTRFLIRADESTSRLEVEEGSVAFEDGQKKQSVVVKSQQFAVVADGRKLMARPLRHRQNRVALYRFDEGKGLLVHDHAHAEAPLHLRLESKSQGSHAWTEHGLELKGRAFLTTGKPATRLIRASRQSGQITLEAWVTPAAIIQSGPARIMTLSRGSRRMNFILGHGQSKPSPHFVCRINEGIDWVELTSQPLKASSTLTHLVFSVQENKSATLYVDGKAASTATFSGDFSRWGNSLPLSLGDDPADPRSWSGTYHWVAIYDIAFDADMVRRHFEAGEKP